jgi:hypothetical protein
MYNFGMVFAERSAERAAPTQAVVTVAPTLAPVAEVSTVLFLLCALHLIAICRIHVDCTIMHHSAAYKRRI